MSAFGFLKFNTQPFRFSTGYEYCNEKIKSTFSTYYYDDQTGTLTNTQAISLSYNYHLKITPGFSIKTGIQFNILRRMLDFDQLTFSDQIDPVPGDIEIDQENGKAIGIKPDINLGILLQKEHLSVGSSVVNVFRPAFFKSKSGDYNNFQLPRYFTFLIKYDIQLSNKFLLAPSLYYFNYGRSAFDIDYLDISANFSFNKIINLGTVFTVGNIYRVTVFAGVKISKKLNLQFDYWLNTNEESNGIGPTIEGLISYSIN